MQPRKKSGKVILKSVMRKLKKLDTIITDIEKDFDEIEIVLDKLKKERDSK